jgi:hypothetical protein
MRQEQATKKVKKERKKKEKRKKVAMELDDRPSKDVNCVAPLTANPW